MLSCLRDFGAAGGFNRRLLRSRTDIIWVDVLQIVELALPDLLAHDIDVVGHVDLLESLGREPWQQTQDDGHQRCAPEGQRTVHLGRGLIERETVRESGVDAGPEEDEQDGDAGNEHHEPVPTVSVEQYVSVDDEHRRVRNVDSHALVVVDAFAREGIEGPGVKAEVREIEADHGLVQPIHHIEPELGLRPFLSLNATAVQLRHGERDLVVDVLVQDTHENDWERCEGQVVKQNV